MEGRTLEHSPLLASRITLLGIRQLQDDRKALHQEDATQDGQQQFLVDDDGSDSNHTTNGKATGVTHEHLRWIGIVPQETDQRSHKGAKEYQHLFCTRNIHDIQVTLLYLEYT